MKVLFLIILLVICAYVFRHEITDKIKGEMRHAPKIVQEYNQKIFGAGYFVAEQKTALELAGICSQNSLWLNDDSTWIFTQNCADAKDALK
jgi:hypothetical protein